MDIAKLSEVCMYGSYIAAHALPYQLDCLLFNKVYNYGIWDWLSLCKTLEITNDLGSKNHKSYPIWNKPFPYLTTLHLDVSREWLSDTDAMNKFKLLSGQLENLKLRIRVTINDGYSVLNNFSDWQVSNLKFLVIYDDLERHHPYHWKCVTLHKYILFNNTLTNLQHLVLSCIPITVNLLTNLISPTFKKNYSFKIHLEKVYLTTTDDKESIINCFKNISKFLTSITVATSSDLEYISSSVSWDSKCFTYLKDFQKLQMICIKELFEFTFDFWDFLIKFIILCNEASRVGISVKIEQIMFVNRVDFPTPKQLNTLVKLLSKSKQMNYKWYAYIRLWVKILSNIKIITPVGLNFMN